MNFNLIIASKGDKNFYLDRLFTSIYGQHVNNEIKIYFVDQNRDDRNGAVIEKWSKHFEIVFISDLGVGLSRARNVGLDALYSHDLSNREVVLFPDDDCVFYKDFFSKISVYLRDENIHGVFFRVYDVDQPDLELSYTKRLSPQRLDIQNVFASITSINFVHTLQEVIRFDEDFGLGGKFNSSEEILYISELLNAGFNFQYIDEVKILHPSLDSGGSRDVLYKKVWDNSIGHGALASQLWRLGAVKASMRILVVGPLGRMIVSTLTLDIKRAKIAFIYLIRRWYGFWKCIGR